MKILSLETTGKYGSASVIDEEGAVYTVSSVNEMNHLKEIIDITDEALAGAGISKGDLTHVAASVGPGSFTGIRIGVTTARTLGQMLEIPCIAVSSLEAMAVNAADAALEEECTIVAPIINARRHQTYAGAWTVKSGSDGPELEECLPCRQYMIEEYIEEIQKYCGGSAFRVFFTGDGVDAYESIIEAALAAEEYRVSPEESRYQTAETVGKVALARAKAGKTVGYEDLKPDYMRLSEAEQRLRDGTLSAKIRKQH